MHRHVPVRMCNMYSLKICITVPCQVGQYWTSEAKVCSDCPIDTFQDEEAQAACTDCPEGHYSDDTGAASASTCKSKATNCVCVCVCMSLCVCMCM